jgi:viroplasmin and RNaseH domain-containing protein
MSIKYEAYVDGSFIGGNIGYGSVILKDGQKIAELSGAVDPSYKEHRQVAGELEATVMTLEWCKEHEIDEISICYDYKGIECWATGEWRAKKDLTKAYVLSLANCKIKINWVKVDAHSGVEWNEYADKLAKAGAAQGKAVSVKTSASKKIELPSSDLVAELEQKSLKFVEYLLSENINAVFQKVMNNMFARIEIYQDGERNGIFDLYNTAKKPFSADLRAFKDQNLKNSVLKYWKNFHKINS